MKIHQDGAGLFRMDRRMDRHRQTAKRTDGRTDSQTGRQVGKYGASNGRFSQFCECAKKLMYITLSNAIIY